MNETPQGRLVVLAGLPGAGKTTLADWLSAEHGFAVASRDTIRTAMFPRCRFTEAEKAAAFIGMKASISTMLTMGMSVVTDGMCFSSRSGLTQVLELAASTGAVSTILHCRVPIEIAQLRVEEDRRTDPTVPADRDSALVQVVADRFEPLPAETIVIDTSAERHQIRAAVAAALSLGALP